MFRCASPTCPGLSYKASDMAHPQNCGAERREPTEVTRAICGPYMPAIQMMADKVGESRAVVIRSMIGEWFANHPEEAKLFGVPPELIASVGR